MTEIDTRTEPAADVFAAARWLDELWNSTAKAVSPTLIEWQCTTWGSGRGGGDWTETATFLLIAALFGLDTGRNREGRDELVVWVPLDKFDQIAELIDRLGEEAEAWPWLDEEDGSDQIAVAAQALGREVSELDGNPDLLEALRIE